VSVPPEAAAVAEQTGAGTRAGRLAGLVAGEGLDQLLVADLVTPGDSSRDAQADVFWLTGFGGTSAICIVGPSERLFLTDFRYVERAAREVDAEFDRERIAGPRMLDEAAKRLRGRVGYDQVKTSVRNLRRLEEAAPEGVELVAVDGLATRLRRGKDEEEVRRIAEAARLTDEVYEFVCERGLVGRTDRAIQLAAEQRMRELGARDPSFPAIVAAGEDGAIGHHEATGREIRAGELVVIDMGAIVDGYCSDCTRTFATGEIDDDAREAYEVVRSAQAAAVEALRAGMDGSAADAIARDPIEEAGYGELFGHGLGHGVGIQVHEAPRLGKSSEDVLAAGDVVTVEPGIYEPGRFGVRIEDLVVVRDDGVRNLSSVDKSLHVVD
jgi:Xaa-Pro aminopeptidase